MNPNVDSSSPPRTRTLLFLGSQPIPALLSIGVAAHGFRPPTQSGSARPKTGPDPWPPPSPNSGSSEPSAQTASPTLPATHPPQHASTTPPATQTDTQPSNEATSSSLSPLTQACPRPPTRARPNPTSPRFQRQRRLGPVQRLDLGFLIEAEHHRPLRRVQVKADDIDQLLLEPGIVRQFERVHPPRSNVAGPPDPSDGVFADTVTITHRPGRPRRRLVIRHRVQRVVNDGVDHRLRNLGLAAPARRDRPHRLDPALLELGPPPPHRVRRRRTRPRDHSVRRPISGQQQRRGLHHTPMRQRRRASHPLQLDPLLTRHPQPGSSHNWHTQH